MMLFDYECPVHGAFESWGSSGDTTRCPKCRRTCRQMIGSKGILLEFNDEGFPRASRMWADWHERAARQPEPSD